MYRITLNAAKHEFEHTIDRKIIIILNEWNGDGNGDDDFKMMRKIVINF